MNRPRNRQPRPPQQQGRGGRRGARSGPPHSRSAYTSVPSTQQVVPGASVSIVLKQDQPTGREVQGIVQDLLTRGDHPRGIKVRLQDGRVGRVQRMVNSSTAIPSSDLSSPAVSESYGGHRTERLAGDDVRDGPLPRTLADFLPGSDSESDGVPQDPITFSTATAKCPICGTFEGDEIAVSRHVESHLTWAYEQ